MKRLFSLLSRTKTPKSQPSSSIGIVPKRKSCLTSLVLAKLIAGEKLNSVDFALQANTGRLKDLIASLRKKHGWGAIESGSLAKATSDGRVQWVSQYWLPQDLVDILNTPIISDWVKCVRQVHRVRRLHSQFAFSRAIACNAKKNVRLTHIEGEPK